MNDGLSRAGQAQTILIDGVRQAAASGEDIAVIDPGTGAPFAALSAGGATEIDRAVLSARRAYEGAWGRLDAAERGRLLLRLAGRIAERRDELAALESHDTGKPLRQARADAEFCARYFEFYGSAADKLLGETIPYRAGFTVMTLREPFGVSAHIVPWNYPLQIMGRSVGASLAAGNACVVKPAEDASLSILRVAELALECGLPEGAFNVVTGYGNVAGAALAAHPGIDHLSFTGSPATGSAVQAAVARNNVGCTMELGGKSAQIVFPDADIDAAVPVLVSGIIQNAGQTCSAGSRALIARPVWDEVLGKLAPAFRDLTIGHGRDDPDIGPLINARQLARVKAFIAKARGDGLPVLAEGTVPGNAPAGGYFVAPILFGPVPADHPIAQEEVFGPVLAATPFDTEEEAIRLANGTPYGLVASVWTKDGARQMRMARKLRCGQVFLNNFGAGGGVELPFGGVKRSGFGREKGLEGLKSFTQLKTVAIKHG